MSCFVVIGVLSCASATPLLTPEFIQETAMKAKWEVNPFATATFEGLDSNEVENTFLGLDRSFVPEDEVGALSEPEADDGEGLPEEFDARNNEAWQNCASLLNLVRDQSRCGSCWAFSSTSSFNDRHCIATGETAVLGVADVISCCSSCGNGCQGGWPGSADRYFVNSGSVTGGLYGSDEGCYPYPFPECAHHVETSKYPSCNRFTRRQLRGDNSGDLPIGPDGMYSTPTCDEKCTDGFEWSGSKKYGRMAKSYSSKAAVKRAMVQQGPVSATLTVYKDFLLYSGGVYQRTSWEAVGGHAVKCLGYGVEDGVEYVLCANSWNGTWGDEGFFKIDWDDLDSTFYAVEM